jgi:hypothetical protein
VDLREALEGGAGSAPAPHLQAGSDIQEAVWRKPILGLSSGFPESSRRGEGGADLAQGLGSGEARGDRARRRVDVMPAVAIYRAPRCQSVLAKRRPSIQPPYDKYTDYLLAEEIAHTYSEITLKRAGVNFWTMDGVALIEALERMLTKGTGPVTEHNP